MGALCSKRAAPEKRNEYQELNTQNPDADAQVITSVAAEGDPKFKEDPDAPTPPPPTPTPTPTPGAKFFDEPADPTPAEEPADSSKPVPSNKGQEELYPDIKMEATQQGVEKGKDKANSLFRQDNVEEDQILAELARSNPDKYVKYLMTHLDDLNGKDIDSTVESIFKEFDEDGNGVLTGNEYGKCVQKLAEHMLGEYEEHLEKVFEKMSKGGVSKEEIDVMRSEHKEMMPIEKFEKQVIELVDVDGDGEITLQEAMDGFHKVVDAIE